MSTLDKYNKIQQESQKSEEHEIRVSAIGRVSAYITYAAKLFLEKKLRKCVLKGSGQAISKVCMAAEILRQRIKGLHEENKITSIEIVDVYEPIEEGLDTVKLTKNLTVFEVILSLDLTDVNLKSPGYQAPLPEDQVKEFQMNFQDDTEGGRRGRGRRGGRRGDYRGGERRGRYRRGGYQRDYDEDRPRQERENRDEDYDRPRGERRFRRRGRGRGGYENRDQERENRDEDYDRPRGERRFGRRGRGRGGYENRDYRENRENRENDRPRSSRGTRRG